MARKNVLAPQEIAIAQSMAASFNSTPTIIDYMDNCAYQINITTSNSTGTFSVQASLDYEQGNGMNNAATGNWIDLTLDGTPAAAGANDNILINLNQVPYRALRIAYTSSVAGTGHCDIWIMNKSVGA